MKRQLVFTLLIGMTTWLGVQLPPPCPSNTTPPADLCQDVCIYCNFNGISSTTAGYTSQTPPGFCGTIENEQWLGFIASGSFATFTATPTGSVFPENQWDNGDAGCVGAISVGGCR